MVAALGKIGLVLAIAALLSACSKREPDLKTLSSRGAGPDEFSIVPGKPLTSPTDFSSLPVPTPGQTNLTDPTPQADAIATLGGNPSAVTRTDIPSADRGLINYASRKGVQPNVRDELAAADYTFRKRRSGGGLAKWFNRDRYAAAYKRLTLDQYLELERLRAAGVKTPDAPPQN